MQTALQQTPEVLHSVGVDVAVYILDGVVDNGMLVINCQPFIRFQLIAKDRGTGSDAFR
jgi:hypothetical protein